MHTRTYRPADVLRQAAGAVAAVCLLALGSHAAQAATPAQRSILFIGNSFTYGAYSPVRYYRNTTVEDLNHEDIGGVPALFKSFTQQAGLPYEVMLETHGGIGLDWHLKNKSSLIAKRPYDVVVMHGLSTLDAARPGDPALLVQTAHDMAALLKSRNDQVKIFLTSTWSRPDQTFVQGKPWYGKDIFAMAQDVRSAYDQARAADPAISGVIPVGQAFSRAIRQGIANQDPYKGVSAGTVDLWTYDHYHASMYGYYLEALMVFGRVTQRDPRMLGETECSAYELGISPALAQALQQVAFDELSANADAANPAPAAAPNTLHDATRPVACVSPLAGRM